MGHRLGLGWILDLPITFCYYYYAGMFHLAESLYNSWTSKEGMLNISHYVAITLLCCLQRHFTNAIFTFSLEYSILLLGVDNAGKTTLLEEVKSQYIPNYKKLPKSRILPTMGQNIATVKVAGVYFKFWDVGSQESLRVLWNEYYDKAHAIVFVIDSCDKDRLEKCIAGLAEIDSNDQAEGLPILMLANKQDLKSEGKMELANIKQLFNPVAENLNAQDSRVLPVSATTGEGVKEAIEWLRTRVTRNKLNRKPNYRKHRRKR